MMQVPCGLPPVPRFGGVELYQENANATATFAARFTCSPGYTISGSVTVRCNANNRWDFAM